MDDYGICVRVVADFRKRARARSNEVGEESAAAASVDATQVEELALREARAPRSTGCSSSLDDDKRAVFILFEIEELPMIEVAAALGCPLQTAYSRLHAARRDVDAALREAAG